MKMVVVTSVDQVLHIRKRRKRKTKMGSRQRYNHRSHFWFSDQDTIESVITFRIDSHTIKKGKTFVIAVIKVPLGEVIHAYALGPSELT